MARRVAIEFDGEPISVPQVSTKEHCRILWLILIETEGDDLLSPARGIAEAELKMLLGDDWRDICLKEWPE